MNQIVDVRIDWMERFTNAPRLIVRLNEPLKSLDELTFDNREDCFLNVDGDIACFFFFSKPSTGFGGRHFTLNMTDGTQKVLIGPWSGCSNGVNKLFPEIGVTEVTIEESEFGHIAGAATISALVPFLKKMNIRCGIVDEGYGQYFQPLLEDGTSKSKRPVIQEF